MAQLSRPLGGFVAAEESNGRGRTLMLKPDDKHLAVKIGAFRTMASVKDLRQAAPRIPRVGGSNTIRVLVARCVDEGREE